jgi:hypothetical protein
LGGVFVDFLWELRGEKLRPNDGFFFLHFRVFIVAVSGSVRPVGTVSRLPCADKDVMALKLHEQKDITVIGGALCGGFLSGTCWKIPSSHRVLAASRDELYINDKDIVSNAFLEAFSENLWSFLCFLKMAALGGLLL